MVPRGCFAALMRRFLFSVLALTFGCVQEPEFDLIVRGGTIYDGSGGAPYISDVGIRADSIAAIGDLRGLSAHHELDAHGLAVAPGFINMLSWATESLIIDGTSQSDIRQGVTLEIFGEGVSMGPLNDGMKEDLMRGFVAKLGSEAAVRDLLGLPSDEPLVLPWTTLREYLDFLVEKGISPNVASFVGATTVRIHELGHEDRPPTDVELERMKALVRQAMEEGAVGVGSSLIYAPAFYAETDELLALASVAAEYDGMYISHLRSEGNRLLESVDELIGIARDAGVAAEIYHLKAAGRDNWHKLDAVIERIEAARAEGLEVTADMYTYTAGATGLNAAMPPSVQEGGFAAWRDRLKRESLRDSLEREMTTPTDEWENLLLAAGPENTLLVGFRSDDLRRYTGRTLAEVSSERGTSPARTAMDLVVEDSSRVETVYFLMSEENVRRQIALPWVSFDSDAGSMAPEGVFLNTAVHPRAYGNFARLLGHYIRVEGIIALEEAVRRLTTLPANNLHLARRGALLPGYFADLAIFDAATIIDHATFDNPHQYATGMVHVLVNGEVVLRDGEHTGKLPGRVVERATGREPLR